MHMFAEALGDWISCLQWRRFFYQTEQLSLNSSCTQACPNRSTPSTPHPETELGNQTPNPRTKRGSGEGEGERHRHPPTLGCGEVADMITGRNYQHITEGTSYRKASEMQCHKYTVDAFNERQMLFLHVLHLWLQRCWSTDHEMGIHTWERAHIWHLGLASNTTDLKQNWPHQDRYNQANFKDVLPTHLKEW